MTEPTFGITQSRPDHEPVPVLGADFSKALLIETSQDAIADTYPLNEPVRISTSDPQAVSDLGTGLLADAVHGINAQLQGLAHGADVTVVRVEEGGDAAATMANIVSVLNSAGSIPSKVNTTPRLVYAGRTAADTGSDLNPVLAALPAACEKLLAIAPVDIGGDSAAACVAVREALSSQRLMPIGVGVRVYEEGEAVTRPAAPRVVGLFMRVDNASEGKPFNPVAMRPLYGIAGLARDIDFSLLDGSTEGQQMLEGEVSIIARGESGVDGAAGDGGFYFIGTDNAATGELWKQIHQVRGADYLTVKLVQITQQFLGRPVTVDIAEAYANSILFMLRDHKAAGDILGYNRDVFTPGKNSPEQIRLGRIRLDIGIEPAPVFRRAHHEIHRYRPAVEGLVAAIVNRLNVTAGQTS